MKITKIKNEAYILGLSREKVTNPPTQMDQLKPFA